jgi:hypothetical protein
MRRGTVNRSLIKLIGAAKLGVEEWEHACLSPCINQGLIRTIYGIFTVFVFLPKDLHQAHATVGG